MLLVVVQTIATALACYGLWRLVRFTAGYGRLAALIVGLGFSARALLSVALFWISYLRLPLGRSLQLGPGFWFFGLDGEFYFSYAIEAAHKGPEAILRMSPSYPALTFVQVFAFFVEIFGAVPSVGILLNCLAYLGICILVLHLGRREEGVAPVALAGLAAISFSPSFLLITTQPLKDTFFHLLLVAMVALSVKWHELWTTRTDRRVVGTLALCAVAMVALFYATSVLRWYFGLLFLGSCAVLFVWQAIVSHHKIAAIIVNAVLLIVLTQAVLIGGRNDIPVFIADILRFRVAPSRLISTPVHTAAAIDKVRRGFEYTPGATNIQPGSKLGEKTAAPPPSPPPVTAVASHPVQPSPAEPKPPVRATIARKPAARKPVEKRQQEVAAAPTPVAALAPAPAPAPAPTPVEHPTPAVQETVASAPPAPPVHVEETPTPTTTSAPAPPVVAEQQPKASEPEPAQKVAEKEPEISAPAPIVAEPTPTPAQEKPSTPVSEKVVSAPVASAPKVSAPVVSAPRVSAPPVSVPQPTPAAAAPAPPAPAPLPPLVPVKQRLASGVAATLLPRAIAQRAGLIDVGGGRGFWFFADLDTIVFDIVLIFAVAYCVRQVIRRRGKLTPMFVQVLIVFVVAAGPVVYAIVNFGTLFRHRQMIFLGLCLLPIALIRTSRRHATPPTAQSANAEDAAPTA